MTSWKPYRVVKGALLRFSADDLTDWAGALTYYAVLSIFPGILVLVSIFGLVGASVTKPLIDDLGRIAPGPVHEILAQSATSIQSSRSSGIVLAIGLVTAFWAASGYIGAFQRAANVVNEVTETRKIWLTIPLRLAVTVVVGVILGVCAVIVVFTGGLAEYVGGLLGFGGTAVTVWEVAKWPVLVLLVMLVVAILYWASPDARVGGFHWLTAGSVTAVLLWIVASAGFALYAANFASYDKTYGTLGGVIVFLVWLWITNLVVLFGAEIDAELRRQRAAGAPGVAADEEAAEVAD